MRRDRAENLTQWWALRAPALAAAALPGLILSLLLVFCAGNSRAAPPETGQPARPRAGETETDTFLSDLATRPRAEQNTIISALIAQLPPGAAGGDPARAKRLLVAALGREIDAAHRALWFAPVEKSAPVILEAIENGEPAGQRAGMDLMHLVIPRTHRADLFRSALPTLRKAIVSEDRALRSFAVGALGCMGEDGVRVWLAALASGDPVDLRSARFIASCPDIAVPELRQAIRAGEPRRGDAVELLKSIAPEGKEIVPLLVPLLDDGPARTRAAAASVLGLYGTAARPAVPALLRMAAADDRDLQWAAGEALARIGIEPDQLDALWSSVLNVEGSGNDYVWFYNFGHAAASAGRAGVPAFIKALSHSDRRVRRAAVYALAYLGPVAAKAAMPLLKTATGDADNEVVGGAFWALGNMGSAASPAVPALVSSLEKTQFGYNIVGHLMYEPAACRILADIGPAALPALYAGLTSDKLMVQAGCAKALGMVDPTESGTVAPRLFKLSKETKNETLRTIARQALTELAGGPRPGMMPKAEPYAHHVDTGAFAWGQPSGGLQLGVRIRPPADRVEQRQPDSDRLVLAVRNVGAQPAVLPFEHEQPLGLDFRLAEVPDVLSPLRPGCHDCPGLRELRPGQTVVLQPALHYQIAYGRRSAQGRWTGFRPEKKEYHLTVTLRDLDRPDPPHVPCYASDAIRRECWRGEVNSASVGARLDVGDEGEIKKPSSK